MVAKTAPLILSMGETLVRMKPVKKQSDAQVLYCKECDDVIWTVSHPYFTIGQVRHLHGRGLPDHSPKMYAMDGIATEEDLRP